MSDVVISGIDGMDPMGFLAAVGALCVVDRGFGGRPRLRWSDEGFPIMSCEGIDRDSLPAIVHEAMTQAWSAVLSRYMATKER